MTYKAKPQHNYGGEEDLMYINFHLWRVIHLDLGFLYKHDYGMKLCLYNFYLTLCGRHILSLRATVSCEHIQRHCVRFDGKVG